MKRTKSFANEGFKKIWLVDVYDKKGNFDAGTQIEAYDFKDAIKEAQLWMEENNIIPLLFEDGIYIDYEVNLK